MKRLKSGSMDCRILNKVCKDCFNKDVLGFVLSVVILV